MKKTGNEKFLHLFNLYVAYMYLTLCSFIATLFNFFRLLSFYVDAIFSSNKRAMGFTTYHTLVLSIKCEKCLLFYMNSNYYTYNYFI